MPDPCDLDPRLLDAARAGDKECQGELLAQYEPWLKLLARVHMETCLKSKFDPTDAVQEAMLQALRSLHRFRGHSRGEFIVWLKTILRFVLSREMKKHGALKRDVGREVRIEDDLDGTCERLYRAVPATGSSPSQGAMKEEASVRLAYALERLPADYREVILLHNLQSLPHEEVAQRMGRTVGAVRMLWVRALTQLREILKPE